MKTFPSRHKKNKDKAVAMVRLASLSLSIVFGIIIISGASQKDKIVSGMVYPAGISVPIREVVVQIDGQTDTLMVTLDDGRFEVRVDSFPVNLKFSKPTYDPEIIKVKRPSDISVYLKPAEYEPK